jgi:hypothetical protein
MQAGNRELNIVMFFRELFKKTRIVDVGDLGIYHFVWGCDTINEDSHGLKYDVYAKVKAASSYDSLVEVDVVDIKINDSASVEIQNIIKNNFPKYVNPKYVKWQLKNNI